MAKSKKDIRRLTKGANKMLLGVCDGIADYLSVDTTIIRLLWIVATAMTGFLPGMVAYIIAAVVIPEK